ncbi:hypothetical protein CIP107582_01048 [Corynebacterium diphtheriae]|uniref:hypothetical protein n=1 Tax=Corynebacterium belfantii TaxID=2014537 RepID=UPI0013CAA0B9|nr:hypothetical protein [Corynebacterium belfantii]MBG9318306.1 hypothetical protein [Corynebacterium belfantii]CAB0645628.1 hypothetical protein CIP107582_01048 [Corynebacterium diphtheriae]
MSYTEHFHSGGADGARWYDQKVTYENLATVAGAVEVLVHLRNKSEFSRFDFVDVSSLNQALTREYGKPAIDSKEAKNEYDKFLSQNLNVLAYARVLSSTSGKPRKYQIENEEVLLKLAGNETECRKFLIEYLHWVLNKFHWWKNFEAYRKSEHTQDDLVELKSKFTRLLMDTMGLGTRGSSNPEVEAGRIFQKVLNLLAFQYDVPGTARGRVMTTAPSKFDLSYNRPNWRDQASNKPKNLTRKEYDAEREATLAASAPSNVKTAAMRKVRNYHNNVSEVQDSTGVHATHVHHIFPQSQFRELADVLENMIALTPGQHLGEAHPHGNTQKIDPVFQRTCLFRKLESVKQSVEAADGMYSYEKFAWVLHKGLGIDSPAPDYESIQETLVTLVV